MDRDFHRFRNFADLHLKKPAFPTSPDDPKSNLFHLSVESARAQFSWTNKTKNLAGEPFHLNAGFLDDFKPNALADHHNGAHFIAMHSSLFVAINEFAMFCFAQRDFFSDVGNTSLEQSPKPWDHRVPGLWMLDFTKHGGHVTDAHSHALIPRDSHRFEISQYLAFLMARFVWLHELAHCFNGHIGLVHQHKLALRLYEISDPIQALEISKPRSAMHAAEVSELLKCLEFDADNSAFWASCNIQFGALENIEGIARLEQSLRTRLTLFGCYAMVWLFEQFQTYTNIINSTSHPEPALRLQNLFRTAKTRLLPLSDQVQADHHAALQQFVAIREVIPGMYDETDLQSQMEAATDETSLASYDSRLERLKSDLQAFEYGARDG